MDNPINNYWQLRLKDLKQALEKNNFSVFIVDSKEKAKQVVLNEIIPATGAKSVSWGGSDTFKATGLYAELKKSKDLQVIDTFDSKKSREELMERRRQALLVDLFICGTNAVTESGKLVNLDMIGNRVAAITYGPRQVIILVGRNKITGNVDDAIYRVKNYAAPTNVMRLDKKNPCFKSGFCEECQSNERICNNWAITEKSYPKGRINIVLINEDLGL